MAMRYVYTGAAILVGLAALAMSWWSIFTVGRTLGIPLVLACGLSSVFDLAALVLVGLSQRYAAAPHAGSGTAPRFALLAMLAGSVFLNVRHAQIVHLGLTGIVAFASPAVIAVMLVELHLRFANSETRYQLGRVAPALPVLGGWAMSLYPSRSLQVIRTVVAARLDDIAASVAPPPPVQADSERVFRQQLAKRVRLDDIEAEVKELEAELDEVRAPDEPLVDSEAIRREVAARAAYLATRPEPSAPQQSAPTPPKPVVPGRTAPAHASDTQNMMGVDAVSNTGAFRVVPPKTDDQ